MFSTLIESSLQRTHSPGGTVVSVLFHSALISGAVFATARETIGATEVREPTVVIIPFDHVAPKPAPREPSPTPREARSVSVQAAPAMPAFKAPDITPVGIPDIDLSAPATPPDINRVLAGRSVMGCTDNCDGTKSGGKTVADPTVWDANDLAMRFARDPVPPRYPEQLRAAGISGSVSVKFVVDTTGRVDLATVEVLSSTHELFTMSVRATLEKLRFNPAMVGTRKVPATAIMPFQFTLR